MNVLLLGSGGRESALAWKLAQSPKLGKLYIAPGNPGTNKFGINLPLNTADFKQIESVLLQHQIDLLVVGPEAPLVEGITDYLKNQPSLSNLRIIGPGAEGAKLEGSKAFAKEFMNRHNIPTAAYKAFRNNQLTEAVDFLKALKPPYVIKADGLAAGKGVVICNQLNESIESVDQMLTRQKFGEASNTIVIEEFLSGIELSVFVITDGKHFCLLPEAKDYKRIGEGDTGPNTGGMGAVSPVPFADSGFIEKIVTRIVKPTIAGLQKEEINYKGFIFFGLIKVNDDPWVIEYNVRMGDPETEVVMPRIAEDLLPLLYDAANGHLTANQILKDHRTAATVMLVSGGYPGDFEKNLPISIVKTDDDDLLFHAGTAIDAHGNLVTSGGRVMAVTSYGTSVDDAFNEAYKTASKVNFEGMYYRKDLGKDL